MSYPTQFLKLLGQFLALRSNKNNPFIVCFFVQHVMILLLRNHWAGHLLLGQIIVKKNIGTKKCIVANKQTKIIISSFWFLK